MRHPFTKMFDKALKKSAQDDNGVLKVAEKLRAKGYQPQEIFSVLTKLHKSLLDVGEAAIVFEAIEVFREYIDED